MKKQMWGVAALVLGLCINTGAMAAKEALALDTKNIRAGGTPVGDLIRVPIKRTQIAPNVYLASGLANTYLVNTPEGAIIIDTGFAHQAKEQMALLKEVMTGPVKYIFLPQGQHDDVGGIPFVKGDDTKIIMTRASTEYMVHRKKVASFLKPRYAALYSWTNELSNKAGKQKSTTNPYPYQPITPDILVEDNMGYKFELGGIKFEVIALPGAEGINSAGLWMPEQKILFAGGGSVGPEIPMWPNLGTVRADRNRILTEYIDTINTMIALAPEVLLPGQDDPMFDKDKIMTDLVLLRDAAVYVHDAIYAGLAKGKDVYELMRDIQLPEQFSHLSQQHGRVEWTVRETVNQTGAWFSYRYTSELYPYRPALVYPELVDMAGGVNNVVAQAEKQLEAGELIKALHLTEVALEAEADSRNAIKAHIAVLKALLMRAQSTYKTFSEIAWLQFRIRHYEAQL